MAKQLKFNDEARIKHISMLAEWTKDKRFVYGGREDKPTPMMAAGDCGIELTSSGTASTLLASLGKVLLDAGVGTQVGHVFTTVLPLDSRLAAVAAYALGMALFTVLMGNAFAAFPVMTAAVGLPIVVKRFGGDPAAVCAIGMLSGFCGTLLTPMAANFNVVPANLLELPDRHAPVNGVIRAQWPTAVSLLGVNIVLMWWLAFPR